MASHTNLAKKLQEIILKRIAGGTLVLPTTPRVADELRVLVQQPELDSHRAGRLVEADPLLAAQLFRVAAQTNKRRAMELATVQGLIAGIGPPRAKEALSDASTRTVYPSKSPELQAVMDALWVRALVVAHLARDVATLIGAGQAEAAFLAGLLYDVGRAVTAVHLVEVEKSFAGRQSAAWIDQAGFCAVLDSVQASIGAAIADAWDLPPAVAHVLKERNDYDNGDRQSPANAAHFASAVVSQNAGTLSAGTLGGALGGATRAEDQDEVAAKLMVGRSLIGLEEEVVVELGKKIPGYLNRD